MCLLMDMFWSRDLGQPNRLSINHPEMMTWSRPTTLQRMLLVELIGVTNSLSFVKGFIPYFKSEWSLVQLYLNEPHCLVAFGQEKNSIIGRLLCISQVMPSSDNFRIVLQVLFRSI